MDGDNGLTNASQMTDQTVQKADEGVIKSFSGFVWHSGREEMTGGHFFRHFEAQSTLDSSAMASGHSFLVSFADANEKM